MEVAGAAADGRSSACTSSSAARRRSSSSTTPTSRPRPRASPAPATSTPARTAPPRPACWCTPRIHDDFVAALAEQARGTAHGPPDDADADFGPLNNAAPARAGRRLRRPAARPRAARRRRAPGRRPRLLLRADRRRRPAPGRRDRAGRGVRPGDHRAALHRRGRGGRAGPTASSTASRPRSGPRTTAGRCGCPGALDFGCVWINTHIPLVAEMPHGGFKHSGYGKDLSMYGFEDYTRIKHVMAAFDRVGRRMQRPSVRVRGTDFVAGRCSRVGFLADGRTVAKIPAIHALRWASGPRSSCADSRRPAPAAARVRALVARPAAAAVAPLGLAGALGAAGAGALRRRGTGSPSPSAATDGRPPPTRWCSWANWTLYLDYDDKTKKYPTLEAFQKQTGIKATYSEDIDDNDTYYGKIQGQLRERPGHRQGHHRLHRLDGRPLHPAGLRPGARPGRRCRTRRTSCPQLAERRLRPGPQAPHDLAERLRRRSRGTRRRCPAGLQSAQRPVGARAQGPGRGALGDARHDRADHARAGRRHLERLHRRRVLRAALDVLQKQIDNGQIRQVKGNSYKEDLIRGDALAVIGWSGDIFQINAENGDKWEFALPDAGGTLLERQPAGADRLAAQDERREAHQLLLRPEGRGRGRGVRQLHLPGRGRAGGDGEDRPGARRRARGSSRPTTTWRRRRCSGRSRRTRRRSTPSEFQKVIGA